MKRAVIYVPGLGDHRSGSQRLAVSLWRLYGVHSEVVVMGWADMEPFDTKLKRLLDKIDTLASAGYQVSLVGASAGATAVINAFARRQDVVHRVVCICGALRHTSVPGGGRHHQAAFAVSESLLFDSTASISNEYRKYILSIRPRADNVVPPKDTVITGANEQLIPTSGHAISIGLAITLFSYRILRFIKR